MKKFTFCFIVIVFALIGTSSTLYKPPSAPDPMSIRDPCVNWSIYQMAEEATGVPAVIIKGIAWAESEEKDGIKHRDPLDKERFGIREKPSYHTERVKKYGSYNYKNPHDTAYLTARIFRDNYNRLKSIDAAIAAHNQGVDGVRNHGIDYNYVARVKKGMFRGKM